MQRFRLRKRKRGVRTHHPHMQTYLHNTQQGHIATLSMKKGTTKKKRKIVEITHLKRNFALEGGHQCVCTLHMSKPEIGSATSQNHWEKSNKQTGASLHTQHTHTHTQHTCNKHTHNTHITHTHKHAHNTHKNTFKNIYTYPKELPC